MEWTKNDLMGLLAVEDSDEYRGFAILYFEKFALAKTEAKYQIHTRPSVYIVKSLLDKTYRSNLKIKSKGDGWYDIDSPLNLLVLGVDIYDPVYIKLEYKYLTALEKEHLKEVIEVIDVYTETEEYKNIIIEKAADIKGKNNIPEGRWHTLEDLENVKNRFNRLRENYESPIQEYACIKPILENFIFMDILRIEELVRSQAEKSTISGDYIDGALRSVLLEKNLGIFSLDNAFDNLLQIREICYSHHCNYEGGPKRTYKECALEWGKLYTEDWRKMHDLRTLYFYYKENAYYRDLFLTILKRDPLQLDNFVSKWGPRIDYSIALRDNLGSGLDKIRAELFQIASGFEDQTEFQQKIEDNIKMINRNISRYTNYLKLIRSKMIYVADVELSVC